MSKSRRGFTVIEVLLVVGVAAIIGTLSLPLFQQMQYRNDLALAKAQVIQGLQIARQYATAGNNDTPWSFFIPGGVIFPGTDYEAALADAELATKIFTISMPDTVRYEGLNLVTYGRDGKPNIEGTVRLLALNNELQEISVLISINPGTVTLTESSSAPASSAAASSATPACPALFTLEPNNVISINDATTVTFLNTAALRQSAGEYVGTLDCYSRDGGSNYSKMFGNGACPSKATGGSAVSPSGGETNDVAMTAGDDVVIRVNNFWKKHGHLTIDDTYDSLNQAARFWYLRNGDSPGPDATHTISTSLRSLLQANALLDAEDHVSMNACDLLLAVEMETLDISTSNYIDSVMKLTFQ